jgi:glyoxylase-like metal-dependent hydrolase (beta-lactamase superfamily II)
MILTDEVFLVAAGQHGILLTHNSDCYVYLLDGGDGNLGLVDAGVGIDNQAIVDNIAAHGYDARDIKYLFLTHVHTDHVGGAAFFRELSGCKVCLSEGEADLMETADEVALGLDVAKRSGFYPMDFTVAPCPVDIRLKDGDEIELGNLRLKAIHSPGHSRAGVSYLMQGKEKRYIFIGDHVTWGGLISLQNYPNSGSSLDAYRESAHKFADLDVDAFLPGHMLFTLNGGQRQLDRMITAVNDLFVKGAFYLPPPIY